MYKNTESFIAEMPKITGKKSICQENVIDI